MNEHIEEARRLVAELEAARRDKMQNEYSIRTVAAVVGLEVDLGMIAPQLLETIDAQAAEITALQELVSHCWVHSGYENCGYRQMTSEQQRLYDETIAASNKRAGIE